MKRSLSAASLLSFIAMSACGVSPVDESSPPPRQEALSAAKPVKCVQNVLCISGDHWDPDLCRCVPDPASCVSGVNGPCGGFTQNPCSCEPGLTCVPNRIPDVPGTCERERCCPVGWDMYPCQGKHGRTGFNCHNPKLACPSSRICGEGCDFRVSGACPVCDPLVCPAGETWNPTLCKCVGCVAAADCTGPLPALCRVCADGSDGCAHWACVDNSCQIAFCQ